MAKKTDEKSKVSLDKDLDRKKAVEEEEVDEEEDEEDEDEDDEDEDDEDDEEDDRDAVPARADDRRHRHAVADDDDDDEVQAPAEEDPTWWAPHAVLGVLVVVGILGFFGIFNKVLGFLAATPGGVASNTTTSQPASKPATQPAQANQQQPPQPQQQQQPQPPREMFGAKHLLVMYQGSRRAAPSVTRTRDEAKARALEALQKARAGMRFEDVVVMYSDEPGAASRGGDLGRFPKGAMVPEFQVAVEALKPGELSAVVETPFGFHVILRTQ